MKPVAHAVTRRAASSACILPRDPGGTVHHDGTRAIGQLLRRRRGEEQPEALRAFVRERPVGARKTLERPIGCLEPACQILHGGGGDSLDESITVADPFVQRRRTHTDLLRDPLHREPGGPDSSRMSRPVATISAYDVRSGVGIRHPSLAIDNSHHSYVS